MSLRKQVFEMVRNDPDISLKDLKKQFPNEKYNSIKTYRNQAKKNISPGISKKKKKIRSSQPISPTKALRFIDDPNELLMSCAIRELNKLKPEVRWATILVSILKETKQLETISKERSEAQSKLKQYSTTDLINLRKKLTGNLLEDG